MPLLIVLFAFFFGFPFVLALVGIAKLRKRKGPST